MNIKPYAVKTNITKRKNFDKKLSLLSRSVQLTIINTI